ncbi:hypothetical protein MKX03_012883 [Papaver bracteatum]|nr:hypothetical protein MKX03_012883 [Papaver bracteatum]
MPVDGSSLVKSFVSDQDKTNILNLKTQSIPPNSTQIILFGFLFPYIRPRGIGGYHSPSDELNVIDFLEFGFHFVINNVGFGCLCCCDCVLRFPLFMCNLDFMCFRGGGFISVKNLLFFARSYKKTFQDLLRKQEGDRAMWEYPLEVVGVDITFMLTQMRDLKAVTPRTIVGVVFAKLLSDNFKLMDQQWLEMRASYMDFNELLLDDITNLKEIVI